MLTSRGTPASAFICCLFAFSWTASSSASTAIYTYTDDSGTQNFTTEFGSIPYTYRHRAVQLHLDSSSPPSVSTPSSSGRPAPAPPAPADHPVPAANARVVQGGGEYPMGDYDTRANAIRMAVEAAKREALEKVATYLESVTEVKNMDVTRDEIRTYTAGIVTVLDQQITTRLEGETVVLRADLTVQVDPEEVTSAIAALRENESAKTELAALRTETDQLQQQLAAANQALTTAISPEQVQDLNQQREDLLNQLQANAYVSQAWTTWGYVTPVIYPYPWTRLQHVNGLLVQAQRLSPRNRHLSMAQEFAGRQAATPPAAPPGTLSPTPPPSLLLPPPASGRMNPLPATVLPGSANGQANISLGRHQAPQTRFPEAARAYTDPSAVRTPRAMSPQTLSPGSGRIPTTANTMRFPGDVLQQQPFWNALPSARPPSQAPRLGRPDQVPGRHSPSGHAGQFRGSGGQGRGGGYTGGGPRSR
jgi:hypothetical protein